MKLMKKITYGKIILKQLNMKKEIIVKCTEKNTFRNLTLQKEYKLIEESKERKITYYQVLNDSGVATYYNKKYFTIVSEKENKKNSSNENKEEVIKVGYAKCINPTEGLTKDKQYHILSEGRNIIKIKNDLNDEGIYLKKRFIFN